MAKNKGFKLHQAQQYQAQLRRTELTTQWCHQAALDAVLITLGYGNCMGSDPWGPERLVRFGAEFAENLQWLMGGLQYTPDADAIRIQVDRLLKAKLPEESHYPWDKRYRAWLDFDIETETKRQRREWVRDGMDTKNDGGTSELLKGVGKE